MNINQDQLGDDELRVGLACTICRDVVMGTSVGNAVEALALHKRAHTLDMRLLREEFDLQSATLVDELNHKISQLVQLAGRLREWRKQRLHDIDLLAALDTGAAQSIFMRGKPKIDRNPARYEPLPNVTASFRPAEIIDQPMPDVG